MYQYRPLGNADPYNISRRQCSLSSGPAVVLRRGQNAGLHCSIAASRLVLREDLLLASSFIHVIFAEYLDAFAKLVVRYLYSYRIRHGHVALTIDKTYEVKDPLRHNMKTHGVVLKG
jgi:hypothetical protein